MIAKLPGWVWGGAWVLAFVAGIVNVVGLLGFQHHAITHLTGNTSLLAASIAHGDIPASVALACLIGAFVLGAALSGAIIRDASLQLGHRYGVALVLVALLLGLAAVLLDRANALGMYAAAGACGLQNAMASTFSGSVVRTTHVSGMFTDLGIGIGHYVRGLPSNTRRVMLSITVITGFFSGGFAGAMAFDAFAYRSLYVAATIAITLAGAYALYRMGRRRDRPLAP